MTEPNSENGRDALAQDPIGGGTPVGAPEADATDIGFMELALAEAREAEAHGDVPVGAVVVRNGEVIASRHNERELTGDPTAHAELLALRDAAAVVGSWRLTDCTLVVTLEPCLMCAGAALNARVRRLVYGAADMAAGACLSLYNVCDDPRLNHSIDLVPGVLADRSKKLLTDFFAAKR
ncbi:MAG: tRNA adenosine(34) deaminase TadA [Actinomycetota bacterium]